MAFLLGNRFNSHQENVYESYDFHVSIEENGYMDFMMESFEESSRLTQSLYAADSMLESMYHQGVDVTDLVTEASNSFFQRTKEFLEKLWAKIKQWFDKVKRFFQILFTSGKEFIKKFESDIRTAASNCSGFKYQFYDVKTDKLKKLSQRVETYTNDATQKLSSETDKITLTSFTMKNASKVRINKDKEYDLEKDTTIYTTNTKNNRYVSQTEKNTGGWTKKKDYYNYLNVTLDEETAVVQAKDKAKNSAIKYFKDITDKSFENTSELQTLLKEAILGDSREEFEDFSKGPAYTEMMDWVSEYQKTKEELDKSEKSIKRALDKSRSEVDENYKNFDGEKQAIKVLDYIKEKAQHTCNYALTALEALKEIRKTLYKDSQSVLKSLLRHKPKTESYYRNDNYDDMLEFALRNL